MHNTRMTEGSVKPWYMAVAVLAVATVLVGEFVLAVDAVQSEFCRRFVEPYGYICAEYTTYSADGFELVMHRIGSKRRAPQLRRSPAPDMSNTDRASFNCETPGRPFNSPRCSAFQPPPYEDSLRKPGQSGCNSSNVMEASVEQEDQTSSGSAVNHFDENEDKAGDKNLLHEGGPFGTDEDVAAYHERQLSELPCPIRSKDQRPIRGLLKISLSDITRSEVKGRKLASSLSHKEANRHHSSRHKHHHGHRKRRHNRESAEYETSDRSASTPSAGLDPAVFPSTEPAVESASSSVSPDSVYEEFHQGRSPVLLMHQEFMSGDSWFQSTDNTDLLFPLLVVNAGFDAWIGHERATYWSNGHLHLNQNEQSYWNWTWDDQAKYDVPAFLQYIVDHTGSAAVHYVGVSQSATVGAAAATMLESSQHMRSLTLIGPTMYRGNTSSILLEAWAFLFGSAIDEAYWNNGYQHGAFNFSRAFPVVSTIYGRGPLADAMSIISGPNCCLGSLGVSFSNGWDGTTSFKNLLHYQQGVRTNSWSHFDYRNPYNNSLAYGVPVAPDYYPEDIPPYIPVLVIYGGRDAYAPPSGVSYLLSRFRTRVVSVFLPNYAHYDLVYSTSRTQDVFIPILQFLEKERWS